MLIYTSMVQVMVWCRQAPSHYLNHWWPIALMYYCSTWAQSINRSSRCSPWNTPMLLTVIIKVSHKAAYSSGGSVVEKQLLSSQAAIWVIEFGLVYCALMSFRRNLGGHDWLISLFVLGSTLRRSRLLKLWHWCLPTTSGATRDENFNKITLSFQWYRK